jgi:uncharacterized repeat protein (TIGR01451 family)
MRFLLFIATLLLPGIAHAAGDVSLTSKVLIEHEKVGADGNSVLVLEEPQVVTPGDPLVFELSYRNNASRPVSGFVLTNPVPASIIFVATDDARALFSTDGGKTWGKLAVLTVPAPDGTSRPAKTTDVTHIRWTFAEPIASGGSGHVSFRGTVK